MSYDTSQPILIVVRRGRNGRGFSISPVEDISNVAVCAGQDEIGEIIIEMLDDPNQPRVDLNDLLSASSDTTPADEAELDHEIEDEHPIDGVLQGEGDLADRAIVAGLTALLNKGRSMSSSRVRASGTRKKRKKR